MAGPDGQRAPQTVRWAVLAMYGGAALTVALTAVVLARWYFQEYLPASRPASVRSDPGLPIGASPFFAWLDGLGGLLICCLWLWTARMSARGHGPARGAATVLFAVPALTVARNAYLHPRIDHVTLAGLLFAASLLAGLAAVVLLWHRSSGPYFRADVPPR
ncbi:MAG TPA: hypothetical protein VF223_07065 [Trebonia sp.]